MVEDREKFGAEELAIVLSHYDLGAIRSIREFVRGSRKAPKVAVDCERGRFLLKRRTTTPEGLKKIVFTHEIQLRLAGQNFPLPHLTGTRNENNSMLVREPYVYELFEFIRGEGYDGSLDATYNAGKILALYHKLMNGFSGSYTPPTGSYHGSKAIHQAVGNTVRKLPEEARPTKEVLAGAVKDLEGAYVECAKRVNKAGLKEWGRQIVHGDWHPGNMLFRERHVVAVIDYDSARQQQRVIDIANGSLQFSILGGTDDPSRWPENIDESRFKRFLLGYDSVNVISKAELHVVPPLMCEAMIAEAVLPIAITGSFGQFEGFPFLQMIQRKVRWILDHQKHLEDILGE